MLFSDLLASEQKSALARPCSSNVVPVHVVGEVGPERVPGDLVLLGEVLEPQQAHGRISQHAVSPWLPDRLRPGGLLLQLLGRQQLDSLLFDNRLRLQ